MEELQKFCRLDASPPPSSGADGGNYSSKNVSTSIVHRIGKGKIDLVLDGDGQTPKWRIGFGYHHLEKKAQRFEKVT